jgi:hypothetical protein
MARWKGKTTKERGYSGWHQKLKEQWRPLVDAGQVSCHEDICLEERDGRTRWIAPGTPWHLSHTPDGSAWTGPSHRRCNIAESNRRTPRGGTPRGSKRRATAKAAASRTRAFTIPAPLRTSRDW